MKMFSFSIGILAFVPLLSISSPLQRKETRVKGDSLVFSELIDLNNKKLNSSDKQFQGKVVLVDIFGTWCPPCRGAIPYLVDFSKKYKSKGLEIIGVAFEREEDAAKRTEMVKTFAKNYNIEYSLVVGGSTKDVDKVFKGQIENFQAFPTLILIGRDGKVHSVDLGFPPDKAGKEAQEKAAAELEKKILELLGSNVKTGAGKKDTPKKE